MVHLQIYQTFYMTVNSCYNILGFKNNVLLALNKDYDTHYFVKS